MLRNKYILSILIFAVWIIFFDANNLLERFRQVREIKQLDADEVYFRQRIEYNKERMKELRTDDENLEKYAREQYMMKKENEDLFLIVTEDEEKKNSKGK